MPAARSFLKAASLLLSISFTSAGLGTEPIRMVFTGDVLLSRNVEAEIARTGNSPWNPAFEAFFASANFVMGNLEGAVGDAAACPEGKGPCFPIRPERICLLQKASFSAMSLANNHSADMGAPGIEATREALHSAGIRALSAEHGPLFLRFGERAVAIVVLSLIPGKDGTVQSLPSIEISQELRLARNLAEAVIVFIHWGEELLEWPSARQREAAEWLVANGASAVIGHHPHVVQPPECISGRPVFFSLGNHLFDQKYDATKRGLMADCWLESTQLVCHEIETAVTRGSFFPSGTPQPRAGSVLSSCPVSLNSSPDFSSIRVRPATTPFASDGSQILEIKTPGKPRRLTRPVKLVSLETGSLEGKGHPPLLFTLEMHSSSLDGEVGLRPHVYAVTADGLVARWRGSALAWPLLDALLVPESPGVLCALHRKDSFLAPDTSEKGTRVAAYRWNGFGFSGTREDMEPDPCLMFSPRIDIP